MAEVLFQQIVTTPRMTATKKKCYIQYLTCHTAEEKRKTNTIDDDDEGLSSTLSRLQRIRLAPRSNKSCAVSKSPSRVAIHRGFTTVVLVFQIGTFIQQELQSLQITYQGGRD